MNVRIPHRTRRDEQGFVLVAVVIITLMLGGLSASFLSENMAEKAAVEQRRSSIDALQICEMGVVRATLEIFALKDSGTDGIGFVSGDYGGGEYSVTAAPHPQSADRWILTATGTYKTSTRRVEVGLRRRANSDYIEGLFAKDTLTFNGHTDTDAYDTRLGTYAAQLAAGGGTFAVEGGHIGSNMGIVLHGSSVNIRGNAIPGLGHSVSTSGNPTVTGDVMPRRVQIDLPPITRAEFEAALANNNNAELANGGGGNGGAGNGGGGNGNGGNNGNGNNGGGNTGGGNAGGGNTGGGNTGGGNTNGGSGSYNANTYELSGSGQDTVTLNGGTYFFTNVRMSGQSKIVVNGPTVIYVTGDFDLSGGGVVNTSDKPGDLIVYSHPYAMAGANPTNSQVKIRGGSAMSMVVYAPGADLSFQGGVDVYGAFIGKTVTVAGSSWFHYDKALGDINTLAVVVIERLYWRDLNEQFRQ